MKPFSRYWDLGSPTPPKLATGVKLAIPALCGLCLTAQPVLADAIPLVRDTEVERMLKAYEDPILHAAGLEPAAVKMYLVQDSSINALRCTNSVSPPLHNRATPSCATCP